MADDNLEMNWVDPTISSAHSNPDDVPAERSVSIEVGMPSTVDYGYMRVCVTADGVEDLPAAVAMVQAALDAAPSEFTASADETAGPPMMDMG